MDKLLLILLISSWSSPVLGFPPNDTLSVDKNKMNGIIINLKDNLKKRNYGISHQKKFHQKDISFVYPDKVIRLQPFDLVIKWKKKSIYIFEIDPNTYRIGRTFDLR